MAATGGSFFSGAVEKRNRNHESRDTSCLVILDGVGKEGIKEIDLLGESSGNGVASAIRKKSGPHGPLTCVEKVSAFPKTQLRVRGVRVCRAGKGLSALRPFTAGPLRAFSVTAFISRDPTP